MDRTTARRVAIWPCGDHAANFPLALDEGAGLLYVGTRRPPAVLSFDTRSGRRAAAVPIAGDADDLWLDGASGRLYASCGAGFIEVLERRPSGLVRGARLATAPGARTALLDAAGRRFYLAVPRATPRPAEIAAALARAGATDADAEVREEARAALGRMSGRLARRP